MDKPTSDEERIAADDAAHTTEACAKKFSEMNWRPAEPGEVFPAAPSYNEELMRRAFGEVKERLREMIAKRRADAPPPKEQP